MSLEIPIGMFFLQELTSQLGMQVSEVESINYYLLSWSRLNISVDVMLQTGVSFLTSVQYATNSPLSSHRVHLRPSLAGKYENLSSARSKAPPPSEGKPSAPGICSHVYIKHAYFPIVCRKMYMLETLQHSVPILNGGFLIVIYGLGLHRDYGKEKGNPKQGLECTGSLQAIKTFEKFKDHSV